MAAASIGFVPPLTRPVIRVRNLATLGVSGSGFFSAERNSKRVWIRCCSAAVEDPVEGTSSSSSRNRLPRLVGMGSKLVGCGSAVPKLQISNDDLAKIVDTNDEWIYVRTGIRNRRVLTGTETLNSLSVEAAKGALQMAEVEAENVDLVILCSSTPDDLFGGAARIQKDLGCKSAWAFDITAACSGFIVGLITATRFIKGGGYKNILVIGADDLSRFVDWTDRGSCILFGDAAGAVLVQGLLLLNKLEYRSLKLKKRISKSGGCDAFYLDEEMYKEACSADEDGLLGFDVNGDGFGQRHLNAIAKEAEPRAISSTNGTPVFPPIKSSYSCIQMNGKEVFRFAVQCVPQTIQASLEEAGLDWLLLHQANQRIIDAVATRVEIPQEKVISNLANYGNTSAASIPLALDEAVRSGRVKAGNTIATAGFGAGLTWGSAIVRWG